MQRGGWLGRNWHRRNLASRAMAGLILGGLFGLVTFLMWLTFGHRPIGALEAATIMAVLSGAAFFVAMNLDTRRSN
jgi:hypothetical protein